MIVMVVIALLQVVLMASLHAVMVLVFLVHGNVITGLIVQTDLMRQIVQLKAVLMINLIVAMATVSMISGNVMVG